MRTYAFRSDLFSIAANEEEQTNPFCYGKSLAEWTAAKLAAQAYTPEPVIPEDWGWCVVVKRDPFLLWVGCGNESPDPATGPAAPADGALPDGSTLTWKCFVHAEVPFWRLYFWRRLIGQADMRGAAEKLDRELEAILRSEPRIQAIEIEDNS